MLGLSLRCKLCLVLKLSIVSRLRIVSYRMATLSRLVFRLLGCERELCCELCDLWALRNDLLECAAPLFQKILMCL